VDLTEIQSERAKEIEPRVHAGKDREVQLWNGGQFTMPVGLNVRAIVHEKLIDNAHDDILGKRRFLFSRRARQSLRSHQEVAMDSMESIREELRQPSLDLRELIPDVMKAYASMSSAAMTEGELSLGVKELLAVVIAITRECDGCMVAHTRGAVRSGVTRQQLAEAIGVAISMNGGPGTVWGPRALRLFDEALAARQA
jgi:AhpD family alkylhydroperoxidase